MTKNKRLLIRLTLGFIALSHANITHAQYTLYESDYGLLSAGLHIQSVGLGELNNHSGGVGGDFGRDVLSDVYGELTIEPNIKGVINLPKGSQLYGSYSTIYSAMLGHDPSGITFKARGLPVSERDDYAPYNDYKYWIMTEEMYIGWRSGDWLKQWGENAIDLSAGAQDYKLGTGLLLANGTDDGGFRGSYWIGSRTVFKDTLIARININNIKLEGFYLENNPRNPESRKRYTGMNIEYNYQDIANFAFSYINDDDYSGFISAETNAYDIRIDFKPLPDTLPDLSISTEYVYQANNKFTDEDTQNPNLYNYGDMGRKGVSGGFGQIEYKFSDISWQPTLSYRYAIMQKGFDFMNYGFKTWGTWFQGEITGEFIFDNTDLITHTTRVVLTPAENVTMNLVYLNYTFDDPKVFGVTSSHYGNEVDLVTDWAVNKTVDLAAGIETFIPNAGGQQYFNGNKVWIQGMVYASFKF